MGKRSLTWLSTILAALLLLPGLATAQVSDDYRHDGFLFRFEYGLFGEFFGTTTIPEDANSLDPSGVGSDASETSLHRSGMLLKLELGGALVENFLLSGVVVGGWSIGSGIGGGDNLRSELETSFFGVGLTYYFMPFNVYVAGSFGWRSDTLSQLCPHAQRVSLFGTGDDSCSFNGFGVGLGVGKEWWVSENWGLGAALHYELGDTELDESGYDTVPMQMNTLGLMLTATYN